MAAISGYGTPSGDQMGPSGDQMGPSGDQVGTNGDQVGTKWDQVGTKSKNVDFSSVFKRKTAANIARTSAAARVGTPGGDPL